MPDHDALRRYLDAGMAFTQLTRQRAEELVRELTRTGEVNRDQATAWVEDLLDRSRQSTETLLGVIRKELDDRIAQLNLVTREDLANLAARLTGTGPTHTEPDAGPTTAKTGSKRTKATTNAAKATTKAAKATAKTDKAAAKTDKAAGKAAAKTEKAGKAAKVAKTPAAKTTKTTDVAARAAKAAESPPAKTDPEA